MTVSQSDLSCPRCQEPLVVASAPDVTLHGCAGCGGIWLNDADSRVAIGGLASPTVDMVEAAGQNATKHPDKTGWVACPECGARLERNHFGPANVDLDYCAQHGTWFDAGELLAVHRAAMGVAPQPAFAQPPMMDTYQASETSGLAIAGLVCSFICSILGLVLSIAALNDIKSSGGRKTGEGLAYAGIALSIVFMMLGCLIQLGRH